MLAEQINLMIIEDFLNGNQYGITNMEQTETGILSNYLRKRYIMKDLIC
jgi:hypothetical protein